MGKNIEKMENIFDQIKVIIKENGIKIIFQEPEFIFGMMAGNIKDNGKIIQWMDSEFIHGDKKNNNILVFI